MGKKFVSIVVPALNEELTIAEFVNWCKEGLKKAGVDGEIIIADSSTDRTAEIAGSLGAKVIRVSKRGLGQAYKDVIGHIRGDYVVMGDCDLTYDFRDIKPFIDKLDEGADFVMGTRMKGDIERGAMPKLHRWLGIPVTTFILNLLYGSRYSDIHCGMRAMTYAALKRINLESSSWEYASEMTLKAVLLKLKIAEVPIRFYKDREGRLSHHKRAGWFSPWLAAWINMKVMFLYTPGFFLMLPGFISFALGVLLVVILVRGQVFFLSVHGMLLGIALAILGYSAVQMAVLSKVIYDFDPDQTKKYKRFFSYNKGVILGILLSLAGLSMLSEFLFTYINSGFFLKEISRFALLGLLLVIVGFQTFTFTLVFQMLMHKKEADR
ncbi:MAG: glycosyltransferase family 2 protein [Candidatus Omnitrophota bacterium]|jgi:glycosyltransferase involved in cell wall biosynthesis